MWALAAKATTAPERADNTPGSLTTRKRSSAWLRTNLLRRSQQLLAADLKNHLKHKVRAAIEALLNGADEFRGLAAALEHHTDLSTAASPPELREAAVGVRAVANQAFLTAATTMGISERLAPWADVSGIVFPRPDMWREPEREGD
jgi:hypothetical protein